MGLLNKLKKEKEASEEKQHQEQQFQQDLSQKTDSPIRPGGVFMIQLLMKEKYEMPSNERFIEILSKHLGKVEQYGDRKVGVKFAAHDYISEMEDASLPVTLMISDCEEFVRDDTLFIIG